MKNPKKIPNELTQAKVKFDEWRKTRTKRVLTNELWSQAIELSKTHGTSLVSKALNLSYESLKAKVEHMTNGQGIQKKPKPTSSQPQFIELPRVPMPPSSQTKAVHVRIHCGPGKSLEVNWNNPDARDWENLLCGLARMPMSSSTTEVRS